MSVCAIMMVKDEEDIIGFTLDHLLRQVDHVIVLDNKSTDRTTALIRDRVGANLEVRWDGETAYEQSKKMTRLAVECYERGFHWVLPCDADEFWYANGRTISEFLGGHAPDIQIVTGDLFNHLPTSLDDPEIDNPFVRMGWRQKNAGVLPKVCCRARPDLTIHMGNHSASTSGTGLTVPGLIIRHYSWRSEEQYLRKIRNGQRAYAATNMKESIGAHWRMFADRSDESVREHFRQWFFSQTPQIDSTLIYDPAPV